MKLSFRSGSRIIGCLLSLALVAAAPVDALSKDKGKGKGKAHGHAHAKGPKLKVKGPSQPHQVMKKAIKAAEKGPGPGRGASAFAPGHGANLPPGHGGVPPGQLKKALRNDSALQRYLSIPASDYALTYGDGYAGRGYYWAPRGMSYFYEAPDVRYYRDRSLVPGNYWRNRDSSSDAFAIQEELARNGYYHGPIDGRTGPQTRDAILRYQADYGLPLTGDMDSSLLRSLGLY